MKKLVWVFGLLFAVSFAVPDTFPTWPTPAPVPAPADPDANLSAGTDPTIVSLLAAATPEERARVVSVYTGFARVLKRDGETDRIVVTTGKFADLQAKLLTLAIEQPGKYPGLDKAIDDVFLAFIGTRDEVSVTDNVRENLITACQKIANSAR